MRVYRWREMGAGEKERLLKRAELILRNKCKLR